jgi:hypothetical protein
MRWFYMLGAAALLTSCGIIPEHVVSSAVDVVNQLETNQSITMEQADALRQALLANTGEPWYMQVGRLGLEVGLALAGVRLWRGPSATPLERVARRQGIATK